MVFDRRAIVFRNLLRLTLDADDVVAKVDALVPLYWKSPHDGGMAEHDRLVHSNLAFLFEVRWNSNWRRDWALEIGACNNSLVNIINSNSTTCCRRSQALGH